MEIGPFVQHYTTLIILGWGGGGVSKTGMKLEVKKVGERKWRQQKGVRKPQITTINHEAVTIFTCSNCLSLAAARDLSVYVCVFFLCLARRRLRSLFSLSSPLLKLTHKQQQLGNHPRQQEAGRCVNSPSTKLGCAKIAETPQLSYLPLFLSFFFF